MKNITDYFEELEHKHDEDKLNKVSFYLIIK